MAGLVAAARARELGSESLVLEKGNRPGGSMLLSSGVIWRHRTLEEAKQVGMEVADIVDAANTLAVFVWGPEHVKIEYVEQKPTFALK